MIVYNRETPILLLIFNRPEVTKQVFDRITEVKPKVLYIAADGARNVEEQIKCEETRAIVNNINWECEVKTLFRQENLGCKIAVSEAITWFFNHVTEGIILEDDCLPSLSFFGFCSALLAKYRNDDRIGHIGGSNFQNGNLRGDGTYYFSKLTHVWGWAGWSRVWKDYDVDMKSFERFSIDDFENSASHAPYKEIWHLNLGNTFNQNINTWDYQYSYSNLINNYLSIIPNKNLITNIGFGVDATHTFGNHPFSNLESFDIDEIVSPTFMMPSTDADIYTQKNEYQIIEVKKGFLSRKWKNVKTSLRNKN